MLTQADFSGLRELLESGEATEEDAVQWLHDNIEKYNIYEQVLPPHRPMSVAAVAPELQSLSDESSTA